MKKAMAVLAILAALPLGAWADVSKDELKRLVQAGISEDVIRTYVKINGPVAKLSSDDLIDLRSAGMSDRLLAEFLAAAANAAAVAAAAPPPPAAPTPDVAGPSVPPPYNPPYDGTYPYPPSFYGSGYAASLGLLPYFVGVPVPVATPVVVTTHPRPPAVHPPVSRPPATLHSTTSPAGGNHH